MGDRGQVSGTAAPVCSSNNPTWGQLNKNNRKLKELELSSASDRKFDPSTPASKITVTHPSGQIEVQGFCSHSQPLDQTLFVIGCLCIVYGIVAK